MGILLVIALVVLVLRIAFPDNFREFTKELRNWWAALSPGPKLFTSLFFIAFLFWVGFHH
jgi:hypothetical protein